MGVKDGLTGWVNRLNPLAEIPIFQRLAQLGFAVQLEALQQVTQVSLDRLGRDRQPGGDLPVGEVETGQCSHLLLAGCECAPMGQVRLGDLAIDQGVLKQVLRSLSARDPGPGSDLFQITRVEGVKL